MYHLFPKKTPKHKETIWKNQTPKAGAHFIPMLLGGLVFFWMLTVTTHLAPHVGDFLDFDGNMPPTSAGDTVVNATIMRNVWATNGQSCRMNLKAMVLAKATVEVAAMNASQVILQWSAAKQTPAIGCPREPTLLAVSADDYQHMVSWKQTSMRPYFRG